MTEAIRGWILGLAGAAIFCAVALELTPGGSVKGVVRLLCGVVMAAALLTPLYRFDFSAYALNMARYRAAGAEAAAAGREISDALDRRVIEDSLAAYILDKARNLGAEIAGARVTVRWSGAGVWYPEAAEISGSYSGALADAIEAELGIPKEAQTWRNDGDAGF